MRPSIAGKILQTDEDGAIRSLLLTSVGINSNDAGLDTPCLTAYDWPIHYTRDVILETGQLFDGRAVDVRGIQAPSNVALVHMDFNPERLVGAVSDLRIVEAGDLLPDGTVREYLVLVGTMAIVAKDLRALLAKKEIQA